MARRRWTKLLAIIFLVLIILIGLGITFTIGWRPLIGAKKRALTDRKFEATPARLAELRRRHVQLAMRLRPCQDRAGLVLASAPHTSQRGATSFLGGGLRRGSRG